MIHSIILYHWYIQEDMDICIYFRILGKVRFQGIISLLCIGSVILKLRKYLSLTSHNIQPKYRSSWPEYIKLNIMLSNEPNEENLVTVNS